MAQRAATMRFAASALVFPGGAVDPADREFGKVLAPSLCENEAAARIAAIREALEEAGAPIGFRSIPDTDGVDHVRRRLIEGVALQDALRDVGAEIDLDALVPFARWQPSSSEKVARVFDTRFYLARYPDACPEPTVDATENVRLFWASAQEVLGRAEQGVERVIFPTRRNLERLAQFDSFDAASAHARSIPVEKVTPWIEERADGQFLCIPEHLGYPITSENLNDAMRG
jgi:8-oxo-dGTP pyrophosphatase MutT (NUDIX family)